ncbi:MAG: S9 family peptidase [Flavobacteriaceae bacterium]|nr:S9 family peptidase [Flavobacteriaceae bacterium]
MKPKHLKPPVAKKVPLQLEKHGDIRIDDFYWMRDKDNLEVIDYLEAENSYYDKMTSHTNELKESLFLEMRARIKEDDESVPYKFNGYWYIVRYRQGEDYPIYARKKESLEAEEEILFDCNEMAKGHSYFHLSGLSVSPDNRLISFGTDTIGRRQYNIQVKEIKSGKIFEDKIENTTGSSTWANDNRTLFYTKKEPTTLRSYQVYRHKLGNESIEDVKIYEEEDEKFGVSVYKSKSRKYIIIACFSTLTNEYYLLDTDNPNSGLKLFQKRITGLEYSISHYQDHFYILTNDNGAFNFKLLKTHIDNTEKGNWEEVIPHDENSLLEDIDIFKDYMVLSERRNGLNKIKVIPWDGSEPHHLEFESETYTAYTSNNVEFDTKILRYNYNSLNRPTTIVDYNMESRSSVVMKEQEILGGNFNKNNYKSERLWASARDGKKIPISLVYHKDTQLGPKTPLLQYAYGSYGHTIDPYFSSVRLSLLDRGFAYAIAHIRGGEYLGRPWYEDGKLLRKWNTFYDFIDVSQFLISKKYTSHSHLYASGGSAGGLLMGVILNTTPELYKGVIAAVPFVDVVTTMLDESIPLTTGEYDEWGNPNDSEYYFYMKSYSPYDNVKSQDYPNILVTSGLHDSQVQYWEPTKWVAKLRQLKTDNNQLFLYTNMEAGHVGASGRFEALKEEARDYAFLLDLENIDK